MGFVNTVPSTDDRKLVKTFAFPFQKGSSGFPAMASVTNSSFANIVSLMMTGIGERIMHYNLGVNLYEYVFSNMTPIQKVRIANQVSNAIETFVPGVRVNNVRSSQVEYQEGLGTDIVFDIEYTVGGETHQQQVVYTPTAQGQ
jgi:phage baseplate assembly protein W